MVTRSNRTGRKGKPAAASRRFMVTLPNEWMRRLEAAAKREALPVAVYARQVLIKHLRGKG